MKYAIFLLLNWCVLWHTKSQNSGVVAAAALSSEESFEDSNWNFSPTGDDTEESYPSYVDSSEEQDDGPHSRRKRQSDGSNQSLTSKNDMVTPCTNGVVPGSMEGAVDQLVRVVDQFLVNANITDINSLLTYLGSQTARTIITAPIDIVKGTIKTVLSTTVAIQKTIIDVISTFIETIIDTISNLLGAIL